jgi:hypothetical protein
MHGIVPRRLLNRQIVDIVRLRESNGLPCGSLLADGVSWTPKQAKHPGDQNKINASAHGPVPSTPYRHFPAEVEPAMTHWV